MKFTKMSLVAALLIGSSAFAIDNVKVSGDAKLFYATADYDDHNATTDDGSMFNRTNSIGQAALGLGATADLASNISGAIHATVLSTMGLENNLVSGVWAGNITAGDAGLQSSNGTAWWIDNAWVAATTGKTTGKIGRMDLDTPLAFTETWNIAKNTFEAAVLINQDIPDTTLVAAYVGGSNGSNGDTVANAQDGKTPFKGYITYNDGVNNALGGEYALGGAGAYAAGIVNNSVKPLTVQAWYYNVKQAVDAYWLQADVNVDGILFGAQYTDLDPKGGINIVDANTSANNTFDGSSLKDSSGYALMLGYEMKDVATFKVAYSAMADDGVLTVQNTATGDQSKLYTEAWWNYGVVGAVGAESYMFSAEANVAEVDLLAQYTHSDVDEKGNGAAAKMDEFTVTASKSFGPLDTTVAYVYTAMDDKDGGNHIQGNEGNVKYDSNMIHAYLTLNF